MLIVISPAKNLDFDTPVPVSKRTKASMLNDADALARVLKSYQPQDLSALMSISDKLGSLNFDRYQSWSLPFPKDQARQALFAFKGDVYQGLDAYNFDGDDAEFAQQHLRILSGLYGVLRPLDTMLPYRLEMGTKLDNPRGKDLYEFWGERITKVLNKQLVALKADVLLNLASNEYFKSVHKHQIKARIVTPEFKDWKNGQYKIISFFAKKARGLMSAYIIKNRLTDVEQIKDFDSDGYVFNQAMSEGDKWVFTRKQ